MKKFFKRNWRYIVFFLLIFIFYFFASKLLFFTADSMSNYGFSHAIKMGEVPYRDFNTVSTPLYAFIMSLGLFIFDNHLMFILEQSIIFTIMFYFLYQIFEKKSYLIVMSFLIIFLFAFSMTYNFFCLVLISIILFLEKKHKDKDLLIGIMLGLLIMTKQTIGVFFIIPSILFYKDKKKLLKRFLGLLIPCLYFLIYLIINKALFSFIDLCFLGLFDFGSKNRIFSYFYSLFLIIPVLIMIFSIFKDKKNILNYYLILGTLFVIPIFDLHHYAYFFVCFTAFMVQYIGDNKLFKRIFIFTSLVSFVFFVKSFYFSESTVINKKFKHFNYLLMSEERAYFITDTNEYLKKWNDPIFIAYSTMLIDIEYDKKIDYYSVPLNGNFGYNGNKKMINKLKKEHDRYIIISKYSYQDAKKGGQYALELVDYVIDKCKFIEEYKEYKVYYKE